MNSKVLNLLCKQLSYNNVGKMNMSSLRIGVVGVPFSKGQAKTGVERAPNKLRSAGLIKELISLGHNVKDYGDIECIELVERPDVHNSMKRLPELANCTEKLSGKIVEIMEDQRKVLTIGGDHSVVLGSVNGHIQAKGKEGKVALLWVDAHPDINTADTSGSGSLHGMPVALLVKELVDYWPYLPGMDWQKPTMSINNLAYIGIRSVDDYERFIIEKYGVAAFGMEDIEQYGIHEVTRLALQKINPEGDLSLHVSFDIDSLDTLEAPSTGTPVRGGLTLREALHVMEVAFRTGTLSAVDIVEINPAIGNDMQVSTTIEAAFQVVKAAFGHLRSGSVPEHIRNLPGFYAPLPSSD